MANDFSSESRCIARWNFEPGALTSDSKGTNTLTPSTSPPTSDGSDFKEGSGSANFVNASDQYFTITDANLPAGWPFKSADAVKRMTVCFWMKLAATPSQWQGIFDKGTYASANMGMIIGTTNVLTAACISTQYATKTLTPGVWYHVSFIICSTERTLTVRVYSAQDGQIDTYVFFTVVSASNAQDFRIGGYSDNTSNYTFDGKLDEFVVFNSCLTDDEVDAVRSGTFPITYPSPVAATNDFSGDSTCVALWRFEPTANFLSDSKGSHTLMSVNGATPVKTLPYYKEGGGGLYVNRLRYHGALIADSNLAAGFPLKSTDTTKTGTFCFWVKPTYQDSNYRAVFSKMDTDQNYRTFWVHINDRQIGVSLGSGTGTTHETYNTGLYLDIHYWHHVTIVFDGVNKFLGVKVWWERTGMGSSYINTGITNTIWVGAAPVTFGKNSYSTLATTLFEGYIDEVVVFNRMLTFQQADQIRRGVYTGTGLSYSNNFSSTSDLIAQYRFESGALTTDSKGTNTLTAVATPTEATLATGLKFKEGACAVNYARASSQAHLITEANMSADFPFKSTGQSRAMTFMCWIRPLTNPTTSTYHTIASKWDWNASKVGWSLTRTYNGTNYFIYGSLGYGVSGQTSESLSTLTGYPGTNIGWAGQWYHIAFAIDGINKRAYLRIYEDGTGMIRHLELNMANTLRIVDVDFCLGCEKNAGAGTNFFDGSIDEALMFNKVLSIQDVDAIRSGAFSGTLTYPAHVQGTFLQAGVRYPYHRRQHFIDPVFGSEVASGYSWSEAWRSPYGKMVGSGDIINVAKTLESPLPSTFSATKDSFIVTSPTCPNLAQNDVLRIGTVDQMNSVYSCAGLTVTLWRPYRGNSGSGLTVSKILPSGVPSTHWGLPAVRGFQVSPISLRCGVNTSTTVQDGFTLLGTPNYAVDFIVNTVFNFWDVSRVGFFNGSSTSLLDISGVGWSLENVYIFNSSGYCRIASATSHNFRVNKFFAENTTGALSAGAASAVAFEVNDLEVFGATWALADGWDSGTFKRFKCGNCARLLQISAGPVSNVIFQDSIIGEGAPVLREFYVYSDMRGQSMVFRNCLFPQGDLPTFEPNNNRWSGEISFENFNQQQGNNFTYYGRHVLNQPYAFCVSSEQEVYRTVPPSMKIILGSCTNPAYSMPLIIPLNTIASANVPLTITVWLRKNFSCGSDPLPTVRLRYLTGTLGDTSTEFGPMISNEQPYPFVASASTEYNATTNRAYTAFADTQIGYYWASSSGAPQWLKAFNPAGITVSSYSIRSRYDGQLNNLPKNWTFEGSNNDSSYVAIDTQTNQTWTVAGTVKSYTCSSPTTYKYHRLNVSANNGGTYVEVARLRLFTQGGTAPSNLVVVEDDLVMSDVSDTWVSVSKQITPTNTGTVDIELIMQTPNITLKSVPAAVVWVDDITVVSG
jgi:hypothetical protein